MRKVIVFLSVAGLFIAGSALAQQTATPEQQAILRSFGINSDLISGNVIQQLTGGCDTNPYPILEQFRAGGNVHITPQAGAQAVSTASSLQAGINSVLACRLSKFLVYAQQTKGCRFTINSAYRSAQEQANICGSGGPNCGSPGRSCHQYGLAVDLTASASCMQWAKSFLGSKNPSSPGAQQFKLHWPIPTDDGHTQCIENTVGNCTPQTQACDGTGNNINPNLNFTPNTATAIQGPLNALSNLFTPPMPQQCPPGYLLMNGSCLPQQAMMQTQTASPFNYASPPVPSPTPSAVTPVPAGTTGTTDSNVNTNVNGNGTNISNIIGSNGQSAAGGTGTSSSAFDLINAIANPTTTPANQAAAATGTPVALGSSLGNTVALHGTNVSTLGTPLASSTYTLSPEASQTFVSQDLSKTPTAINTVQPVNSTFAVLENLKQVLLSVLAYLRPFGGVVPHTSTFNNSTTANLE